VRGDLLGDLGRMELGVGPGTHEVLGAQRGIGGEQRRFRRPKLPATDQQPDRNTCPCDPRLATADRWIRVDTGYDAADLTGKF
jgi:hypothetical protein